MRNITRTESNVLEGPQGLRPWKQTPTLIADTQQHRLATISKQCEIKAFADELLNSWPEALDPAALRRKPFSFAIEKQIRTS